MAKGEKGKIKIRFFEVELEGSDETLLESVRSAAALANRGQSRVVRNLPPAAANGGGNIASQQEETDLDVESEQQVVEAESEPKSKKNRAYVTPQVLDLNLKAGTIPFAAFIEKKKPSTTIEKYLVVAAWLKENLSITAVNIDHIYTCFRSAEWGVQADVAQPLRSGKVQGYFKVAARGAYELTHIGQGVVDKLGTSGS